MRAGRWAALRVRLADRGPAGRVRRPGQWTKREATPDTMRYVLRLIGILFTAGAILFVIGAAGAGFLYWKY